MKKTFTLIELLVVISIIAILAGLLLPALRSAWERGRGSACMGNIKQGAMGVYMYTDDWNSFFPPVHRNTSGAGLGWGNPDPGMTPGNPGFREWWQYVGDYGLARKHLLCPSDKAIQDGYDANAGTRESYSWNGMYSFNQQISRLRAPASRIILSERGFNGSALAHSGYPGFNAPSTWQDSIDQKRHVNVSNYGFADGHAAPLVWSNTTGSDPSTNLEQNMHFASELKSAYGAGL